MSAIDDISDNQRIYLIRDRFDAYDEAFAQGQPSEVLYFLSIRALAGAEVHNEKWISRIAELQAILDKHKLQKPRHPDGR